MKRATAGALRAAAVTVAVAIAATGARAGLPDWAKPLAESAPVVPEGSPDWPDRILLSEVRIVVSGDGATWRIHERRAVQYLTNRAADTAFGFFAFNGDTKVKSSKGWHVAVGERAQRNMGGAVDIALPGMFDSDAKARAVALDGVRKGSLVFFEFDAERKPYALSESFDLGSVSGPVDLDRIVVELPAGWHLRWAWLRSPGVEPVRDGGTWTFELKSSTPPKEEPLGPPPADLTPRLVVAMDPPDGTEAGAPALTDWPSMGRWFQTIGRGRDAADPKLRQAASEALAAAGTDPLARIRAAALYVRDRVRYVARAVGIGGYTPRRATQVLAELNGDCKDKGTLLRAILAVDGFTSYPILINAEHDGTIADQVPDLGAFDHFVVGVSWPKDKPLPDEIAEATIEVPGIGVVFVVDATDEYAWPGTIPAVLAGHRALLITPDGGLLVRMPPGSPAGQRVETAIATEVRPDRSASVKLEVTYRGWPAERARVAYATSAVDRRKGVEQEVRREWPGAEVKEYHAVAESPNGAYVESITFDLPPGNPTLHDGWFPMFAGAAASLDRVPLSRRTVPVVFDGPLGLRFESTVDGVSAQAAPPASQRASGNGWSVTSEFDRKGSAIHGVWSYERSRTRFEVEALPEIKSMWAAASKAASPALPLGP